MKGINKSKYKGVKQILANNTWNAVLPLPERKVTLTGFKTDKEAAKAYDYLCIVYQQEPVNGFYKQRTITKT